MSENNPSVQETTAMAGATLQERVQPWMMACFGPEISRDRVERADRLLEEVFELLQSGDYDPARVLALRDYVWGRDKGEPAQEVGGVMVTLAAYCLAHDLDMHEAGETELARIWTKIDKIRAKQAAKPVGSALPVAAAPPPPATSSAVEALQHAEPINRAFKDHDVHELAVTRDELLREVFRHWRELYAALQAGTEVAVKGVWPEPKIANPDIAEPTGVPYIDCLIHRVLDAQQDINFAANTSMDQSLCDASSLLDEVEATLRNVALAPVQQAGVESELVERLLAHADEQIDDNLAYIRKADELMSEAAASLSQLTPFEMRLCETKHVQLKPNQSYIFTVDPECPMCVGLAEQSKHAEQILAGIKS